MELASVASLLARGLVVVALALEVLLVGYLMFLAVSALLTRPGSQAVGCRQRRFAVLVPAHNEQAVIARTVANLKTLTYPADRVDVYVVADNCDDATARIARRSGALVYERWEPGEQSKGFALKWLLAQIATTGRTYDAYVVVDADSVLAPNFLIRMDAHLQSGALAVQAYYAVLNARQSMVAGVRDAALAAVHYLRPLGRSRFGLSAGLKGNGMCFSADLIAQFAWRWFTLTEDVEFHLALVAQGIRVDFAPETWVKAEMPVTFRQASSQNERWERGRLQLIRRHVPGLVGDGLRQASWLRLDAAIEQLIPPLSVPFAGGVGLVVATLLAGMVPLAFVATICLAGYAVYVLTALALVRAPWRAYLSLSIAPVYIAWKVWLYVRSLAGGQGDRWIRTERAPSSATSS